jgi:hypothetical protein
VAAGKKKTCKKTEAKSTNKTDFFFGPLKKPLAPTGGRGSIYRGYIEHRA